MLGQHLCTLNICCLTLAVPSYDRCFFSFPSNRNRSKPEISVVYNSLHVSDDFYPSRTSSLNHLNDGLNPQTLYERVQGNKSG